MPWLAYTVMVGTMVETKMNSAERLINYWEETPAEDAKLDMGVVDDNGPPLVANSAYAQAEAYLPAVWPSAGAVVFKEYSMR
jgi:hypothetical protein